MTDAIPAHRRSETVRRGGETTIDTQPERKSSSPGRKSDPAPSPEAEEPAPATDAALDLDPFPVASGGDNDSYLKGPEQ